MPSVRKQNGKFYKGKEMKKNIPNYITAVRIAGTLALLFLEPFTTVFFVVYTICGISDVVDGTIARAMGTTSTLGAKLDSAADLSYYAVMVIKIFPVLLKRLPLSLWCIVILDVLMRVVSYSFVAIKYHKFSSMHTYMNKLTGLAVFTIPYYITTRFAVPLAFVGATVAGIASLEELILHFTRREYKDVLNPSDAHKKPEQQKDNA